jgi:hypothetical protein
MARAESIRKGDKVFQVPDFLYCCFSSTLFAIRLATRFNISPSMSDIETTRLRILGRFFSVPA